jgi:hypothetical protein
MVNDQAAVAGDEIVTELAHLDRLDIRGIGIPALMYLLRCDEPEVVHMFRLSYTMSSFYSM